MTDYEGFRKVRKFMLDTGVEMQGELSLKGAATSLEFDLSSQERTLFIALSSPFEEEPLVVFRCLITDRRMSSPPVVKAFDITKDVALCFSPGVERAMVNHLPLQGTKK